jgi:hypothetical protein
MHVEHRLSQLIGEPAGAAPYRAQPQRPGRDRLQDVRRRRIDEAAAGIDALELALIERAEEQCRDGHARASLTSSRASR